MSLLFPPNQLVNALIFYLLVFKDLKCIRARLCVCVCVCVCALKSPIFSFMSPCYWALPGLKNILFPLYLPGLA